MTIRPYLDSDWEAVRDIYDLSKPDEMRGSVDLSLISPLQDNPLFLALFKESTLVVYEEARRVVGFAGYRGTYIAWVYVHPKHRRTGVARSLVQEILKRVSGRITLDVGKNNHAARRLYETLGFSLDQEVTNKFHGHDVQVMKLWFEK